jgi:hypothetical protein
MKIISYIIIILIMHCALWGSSASDYPYWWYEMGIIDANATDQGNWCLVNQGQLKNISLRAKYYLIFKLGLTETEWDSQWTSIYSANSLTAPAFLNTGNNYVVINQGQAKNVLWGFYRMLYNNGYTVAQIESMLGAHQSSGSWSYSYPWTGSDASHYSPLDVGQLKFMFCFDLGDVGEWMDTDGDGIDDRVELDCYNSLSSVCDVNSMTLDSDGDMYSSCIEAVLGYDNATYSTSTSSSASYSKLIGSVGPILIIPSGKLVKVDTGTLLISQVILSQ